MTLPTPSNETLMAYADGMLEPAEQLEVEKLLEINPELRRRVEVFRKTSALIGAAAVPLAAEPVPDALLAAIKARVEAAESEGNVLRFRPAPMRAAPAWPVWRMAAAASVVAFLGGFAGYRLALEEAGPAHIAVGVPPPSGIAVMLESAKSGVESPAGEDRIRLVSSFRLADASICREFEYASKADGAVIAVACKQNGTWNTRFAVASNPLENGYSPASSHEAVEAYLTAVGAGSALSDEEEEAVLGRD